MISHGSEVGGAPGQLRQLRSTGRRALVFAALTLTGLWRSFAQALDGLAGGLERGWRQSADGYGRAPPRPLRIGLTPLSALAALAAGVAELAQRLSGAHLRFVAGVDERLLRRAS